ncbi:MAG: ABC transporter substrate-binding protein [Thermoanaerobacteraceae bacterium]|nr:ABC transporter substrate-binding protein [Thermoanaerobacteraceae bacterium]
MKRFYGVLLIMVMLIGTILSGCSTGNQNAQEQTNQPAEQETAPEAVTLKLGIWSSSPAEKKIVEDQLALFKEKYPNITVEIETIVGDYMQKLQAEMAANTAPDVFYLDSMPAPQLMDAGVLEPLDEYVTKNSVDIEDFQPQLLDAFRWNGKLYGIPKDFNTLVLFYNKKMFEDANIAQPPTNWGELRSVAQKLTKDSVKGIVLSSDVARFDAFIHQNGGYLFKDGQAALNLPQNAEALDYYTGLIVKDKVADTPQNIGVGWNGDAFAEGKAAMAIEGGWMIPFLKDKSPDLQYGMAELPAGKQKATMSFTVAYAMNQKSQHKDEAFALLSFLTGREAQQIVVDSGLAMPSRISLFDAYKEKYPERAAFIEGADYSVPYQYGLLGTNLQKAANNASDAVIMGQAKSAQEALDAAQKEVAQ